MRCLLRLLICSGILAAASSASAQTVLSMEGGARIAALAGAGTALADDPWGHANPASAATMSGRSISFYATEGFRLAELRLGALRYAEPTPAGTFAAGARTFGFDAFRETTFSLGYANGFRLGTSRHVYAGLSARYYRIALGARSDGTSYGSAGALSLSLGTLLRLHPRLTLGAAATNVNAASYADGSDLAQALSIGLAYQATDRLLIAADVFKDIDYPLTVRAGVEIIPVEVLALRVGVANAPARVTAGLGLRLGLLRARLAAERHETLGWTPAAGFALQW